MFLSFSLIWSDRAKRWVNAGFDAADSERSVRRVTEAPVSITPSMPTKPKGRVGRAKTIPHIPEREKTASRYWSEIRHVRRTSRYFLYRLGLAGGISTSSDKAHRRVNEWTTEALHIFSEARKNSRTLKNQKIHTKEASSERRPKPALSLKKSPRENRSLVRDKQNDVSREHRSLVRDEKSDVSRENRSFFLHTSSLTCPRFL